MSVPTPIEEMSDIVESYALRLEDSQERCQNRSLLCAQMAGAMVCWSTDERVPKYARESMIEFIKAEKEINYVNVKV